MRTGTFKAGNNLQEAEVDVISSYNHKQKNIFDIVLS